MSSFGSFFFVFRFKPCHTNRNKFTRWQVFKACNAMLRLFTNLKLVEWWNVMQQCRHFKKKMKKYHCSPWSLHFTHVCKLRLWGSELEVPTSTQSSCCGWISLSTCSRGLEAKPKCNWNLKTGKGLMKHSIFIPKMFQAFLQFSNKSESNQDISFSMETMFPLSNRNKPGPLPSFHAKLHLCEQKGQTPTTTRVVHLTNARAPTFWA